MKNFIIALIIFNLIFLCICGYITYGYTQAPRVSEIHEIDSPYTFINPLLECNPEYEYYNPGQVKKDLDSYIKKNIKSGNIDDAAYYMRLLKNGATFGYNQDEKFISASLVKLPLAMGLMRQVDPQELNTQITIQESEISLDLYDKPIDNIQVGNTYTLYELLSEMLIHSDNTAATSLLEYLNMNKTLQTYKKFGLGLVDFESDNSLNMSVKSYASFFRVLYNASYLSREDSEYLLDLLSQSSFKAGIRALLPNNLLISNKFGVRNLPNGEKYIHDCGNIYYGEEPYLLCVMTKGTNEEKQLKIIQEISKIIFDDITK